MYVGFRAVVLMNLSLRVKTQRCRDAETGCVDVGVGVGKERVGGTGRGLGADYAHHREWSSWGRCLQPRELGSARDDRGRWGDAGREAQEGAHTRDSLWCVIERSTALRSGFTALFLF